MSNSTEVKRLKTMEADTNNVTEVQLVLECTALCTLCPYEMPKLESELAVWLWEMHWAENHPPAAPPASPSCTPLTDSVKLPVILSLNAEDWSPSLPQSGTRSGVTGTTSPPDKRRQLSNPPDKRRQLSSPPDKRRQLSSPPRRQKVL